MTTSTRPKPAVSPSAKLVIFSWALSLLVAVLAFVAWGQDHRWRLGSLSAYQLFPLFGLLAWSLVWSMYASGFARRAFKLAVEPMANYYRVLSPIVLLLILLHPGILWWQLWRDGFGLPPGSYLEHYVAPTLKWAVILGTISWVVMVIYEMRSRLRRYKWWPAMEVLGDAAMAGLFIHALKLGGQLQDGWYRGLWIFYGITLGLILGASYLSKLRRFAKL